MVANRNGDRRNAAAIDAARHIAKLKPAHLLEDAEQALLLSKVNLVTAQTNLVIARYQVLQAAGRLNAKDLALNVPLYDPAKHYNEVRNKWWGTGPAVK